MWSLFDDRPWKIKVVDSMLKATFTFASLGGPDPKDDPEGFLFKIQELQLIRTIPLPPACQDIKINVSKDYVNDVRIYKAANGQSNGLPVFIWIHGGGFCLGSYADSPDFLGAICNGWNGMVMSVGYRLAPKFKYPTGLNDLVNTLKYLITSIDFHFDRNNIFIGGESAGAILSALVAHRIREELPQVKIAGVYCNCGSPGFKRDIAIKSKYLDGHILSTELCNAFDRSYVEDLNLWQEDPLLSFRVPLAGLPPFHFHMAEYDMFTEQTLLLLEELKKENGEDNVSAKMFANVPHGFCSFMTMWEDEVKEAVADLVKWLNNRYTQLN